MSNPNAVPCDRAHRRAHEVCWIVVGSVIGSFLLVGTGLQSPKNAQDGITSIAIGATIVYLLGVPICKYRERRRSRASPAPTDNRY